MPNNQIMIRITGKLEGIVETQLQALVNANKPIALTAEQRAVLQSYYCKAKRKIYRFKSAENEKELVSFIRAAFEQAEQYAKDNNLIVSECCTIHYGLIVMFWTNLTDDQLIQHYKKALAMRKKVDAAKKAAIAKNKNSASKRKAAAEIIAKLRSEFNL